MKFRPTPKGKLVWMMLTRGAEFVNWEICKASGERQDRPHLAHFSQRTREMWHPASAASPPSVGESRFANTATIPRRSTPRAATVSTRRNRRRPPASKPADTAELRLPSLVGATPESTETPQAEQNAPGSAKAAPQLWQNLGIERVPRTSRQSIQPEAWRF